MARLLPVAAAAAALVVGIRLARREWRRVNDELDRIRKGEPLPSATLRRDKATGEWRPSR